jgi:GNAT superfamily N-acetyltransferase
VPVVELSSSHHDRASFDCGKGPLNSYFRETARQHASRNLGVTQVVVAESGSASIMGYFTLLSRTVESSSLPEKKLPRGPLGVVLLGRLAVDLHYQGQGLGKRLLLRAMAETGAAAERVGIYALVLDATDTEALSWYLNLDFGFMPVLDDPNRLYVPTTFIPPLQLGPSGKDL